MANFKIIFLRESYYQFIIALMIKSRGIHHLILSLVFLTCYLWGIGQPTLDPDMKKPKKYENRILRSEKTGDKKFNLPRRFFQNTFTHYNYAFNATAKLNQVIASARAQHLDDYEQLLSFYDYSIENTSSQRTELDSVIYKVNAGILLHDLRSNWMDNLYLLMGQAYYFRNTLDTAWMTFQYMNYAFSPKEADGFDKVIASNANEGGNAMKVATEEDRNIIDRAFSEPPNRNDALVWLVRTHIRNNEMSTAASLIQTLKQDPLLPERLEPELAEVTAWWFYQQEQYDSAAFYLENALPAADDKPQLARWEFLLGQLYERASKPEQAKDAFRRSIKHTINPVMEVAAQLQIAQQVDSLDKADWQSAIDALLKMAKRERYSNYRDLIYYTIAKLEIKREKWAEAKANLLRSIKYNTPDNPYQHTRSYLLLAGLSFDQREYLPAKNYYDSLQMGNLPDTMTAFIEDRKDVLGILATQYGIISRQDSLQKLAAMPEVERNEFLKKQARQLRRQRGIKEEEIAGGGPNPVLSQLGNNVPTDLFGGQASGDWYFYNNALKSRGFSEFRSKWGNRANADNWRRSAAATAPGFTKDNPDTSSVVTTDAIDETTVEGLLSRIPTTPEMLKISNDSILQAGYLLAYTAQNRLEDYETAATEYEKLLKRFPGNVQEIDILYNLAICYRMMGRSDMVSQLKNRLTTEFPGSRQTKLISDPLGVQLEDSAISRKATTTYDEIYDQFISGKFDEALAAKQKADSVYGSHYWTPQLLYIEAVYHIRQQSDSVAIQRLEQISSQFPDHGLADKVNNMIDVLKRRKEIEEYLTNLDVERPAEDSIVALPEITTKKEPEDPEIKAATTRDVTKEKKEIDKNRLDKKAPELKTMFSRHSAQPHFVVVVLNDVDPVYVNESRNAFTRYNKETYYNQPMNVLIVSLTEKVNMVTIRGFSNEQEAIDYIAKARVQADKDIIPWLKSDKYYFMPVAEDNMNLLIANKNLPEYRNFLEQLFPGQF